MGTIADKLNYILETKESIKQAIIDKGVEVIDTDTFRSYADKIKSIETVIDGVKNQEITITTNGDFFPEEGYTGFGKVTVDINSVKNQDLTVTTNGSYIADTGYTGLGTVTVDVGTEIEKTYTEDGTYTIDAIEEGASAYKTITVIVDESASRVEKSYTLTEEDLKNNTVTIEADEGTSMNKITIDLSVIADLLKEV